MPRKDQHVVPHADGWAVKGAGNKKATSVHPTQREAIEEASDRARTQGTEVLIHRRNGQIRERNTYGHDPYPPKG